MCSCNEVLTFTGLMRRDDAMNRFYIGTIGTIRYSSCRYG